MRKMFKNYYEVSKLFDTNILDKKTTRKITFISIVFSLPVMIIYALFLFNACTIYSTNMPILNIFIWVMPIFLCLFFGLISLFTIQLYKNYLPDHEMIKEVKNYEFFIVGFLNPFVIIFSLVICALISYIL